VKLKRATKFAAASSLLLLVVAGCTSASTSSDSSENDSTTDTDTTTQVMDPVEIEFYSLAWQEGAIASHKEIVDAFNAQSEYVTVKHVKAIGGL